MALDPIQQSPFTSYPYFQKDYNTAESFSKGFQDSQREAANRIAMDTAQQQQIATDQAMRLKDAEEARKALLFKRQMGDWARVNSAIAGAAAPNLNAPAPGLSVPSGNGGWIPAAPAATPAATPAAAPPGPQAYNTEADLPSVRGAPVELVRNPNAPGGFYIPTATGAGVNALPTFATGIHAPPTADSRMGLPMAIAAPAGTNTMPMTANVPGAEWVASPIPYQQVNPNAPAITSRAQANARQFGVDTSIDNIKRNLAAGLYTGGVGAYNENDPRSFTEAQLAQRAPVQAEIQRMTDFYNRPDVKQYLRSDPALAAYVSKNPAEFYRQNAASMSEQPTAETKPISVEGANGEPIDIGGRRALISSSVYDAITNGKEPPKIPSNLLEFGNVAIQRNAINEQMQAIQAQWKIAQARRDAGAMAELTKQATALRISNNLLDGMQAITEFNDNRPQRLASILNQMSGGTFALQPREDGTYNVYSGNKLQYEGMTKEQLIAQSRMIFDTQFQQQVSTAAAAKQSLATKAAEAQIKGLEKAYEQGAILTKEAHLKSLEHIYQQQNPEVQSFHLDPNSGKGYLIYKNGRTEVINMVPLVVNGKPMMHPDGKTPVMVPDVSVAK